MPLKIRGIPRHHLLVYFVLQDQFRLLHLDSLKMSLISQRQQPITGWTYGRIVTKSACKREAGIAKEEGAQPRWEGHWWVMEGARGR
jgi:hypothetical protein